ncbi:MAG: MmgE/PrpD family protein [Variibacter sp.]
MNIALTNIAVTSSFSEALIDMLLGHPSERIPAHALSAVQLCMEDTIGVGIAAMAEGVATAGVRVALESGGDKALVWGTGRRATPHDAALANGMIAHGLDFDDTHPAAIMHASAVNIPVALALGEALNVPPREMLAAAVLGYEVSARLGRLGPGPFQDHGFQSTAVLGIFASVFIAARLMKVDRQTTVHAFGVAGSMASGLMEYLSDGSNVKQMHPGWAAHAGMRAVALARAGATGPRTVLEGRFGVFRSYAQLDIDPSTVLAPLKDRFEVELMAPKPYPACLCVHPLVQAALDLCRQGAVDPARLDHIASIHCEVPAWYRDLVFEPAHQKIKPRTAYEGRFSAPYVIARALLDGEVGVRSFSEACLQDARMREIAAKVTYETRPFAEFPASFPALVRINLKDGNSYESFVPHNLGSAGCPLGAQGIEAKFRRNVEPAIGREHADRLHENIAGLAEAKSAKGLWAALEGAIIKG